MKISASIYSSPEQSLDDIIEELNEHRMDFIHIDCNDDPSVFADIQVIRQKSDIPIDLHIISPTPEKYFDGIRQHQPEYVTFQYEDLVSKLEIPTDLNCKLGLAITSETPIDVFADYADDFDFIMFMATTPGKSSGRFNPENFRRIRKFRRMYPSKRIHVDGGVNGEVSFILRSIGVTAAVSGSFLFKANKMGNALLDLKHNVVNSSYQIKDFMIAAEELHLLKYNQCNIAEILNSIEKNRIGFTVITNGNNTLKGLVTNADVRRGFIKHIGDFNAIQDIDVINENPVVVNENETVEGLLRFIKEQKFPVNYLPVVNDQNIFTGALSFANLIKGE